jgi:hypothetical protein
VPMGAVVTLWYDLANTCWRVMNIAATPPPSNYGVKVINTVAQTMAAATYTNVTFNTVDFSYGTFWVASAPTRLTVPAGQGGIYKLWSKVQSTVNSNLRVRFMKNGVICSSEVRTSTSAALPPGVVDTEMLLLVPGDYIEVQAYLSVGGTIGGTIRDDMVVFGMWKM